jgi:hypothetical protein
VEVRTISTGNANNAKRRYIHFLLFGILYVGIQEFWVSVLWKGSLISFALAVVITEVLYLTFAFFVGKWIDAIFSKIRIADLVAYVVCGLVGLITIEWIFVGNRPGETEANQFVMFTTWGGAALFARMMTDSSANVVKVKLYALRFFLLFTGLATLLGLIFAVINSQLTFAITYVAAILGYPIMNVFFIWYFFIKARGSEALTQPYAIF